MSYRVEWERSRGIGWKGNQLYLDDYAEMDITRTPGGGYFVTLARGSGGEELWEPFNSYDAARLAADMWAAGYLIGKTRTK
jgi:hypothetical protein